MNKEGEKVDKFAAGCTLPNITLEKKKKSNNIIKKSCLARWISGHSNKIFA